MEVTNYVFVLLHPASNLIQAWFRGNRTRANLREHLHRRRSFMRAYLGNIAAEEPSDVVSNMALDARPVHAKYVFYSILFTLLSSTSRAFVSVQAKDFLLKDPGCRGNVVRSEDVHIKSWSLHPK